MKIIFGLVMLGLALMYLINHLRGKRKPQKNVIDEKKPVEAINEVALPEYPDDIDMRGFSGFDELKNRSELQAIIIHDPLSRRMIEDKPVNLVINNPIHGLMTLKVSEKTAKNYRHKGPVVFFKNLRSQSSSLSSHDFETMYCLVLLSNSALGPILYTFEKFYEIFWTNRHILDLGFKNQGQKNYGNTYFWENPSSKQDIEEINPGLIDIMILSSVAMLDLHENSAGLHEIIGSGIIDHTPNDISRGETSEKTEAMSSDEITVDIPASISLCACEIS